ncbi:hypothetical protein [Sphingobium olei]|uniref:DUF4375 domain-containing protein n=1 Tax=Sphingobium olei TaxID=420955 RepID=A0ABW3NVZ9_9SPHN
MAGEHGRGGEDAKPEDERRLSLEHVEILEQRLVDRVARDAATGDLVKRRNVASLIWWWQESAGPAVRSWIDANLDTGDFAPWLMATFTSEGVGQAMGDMVGQRMYTVNRDSLSKLVDIDRLSAIAERRIANGEDLDQAAAHFVAGLKSRY